MAAEGGSKRTLIWVLVGVVALGCVGAAALGALFVLGSPAVAAAVERAEGAACEARLRAVYQGIVQRRIESPDTFNTELRAAIEAVDASPSAYVERDLERFPLASFEAGEPLVACSGTRENHPPVLHVLYADGSIHTLSLDQLKADGTVPPETDRVTVGPDSPVPDLRKLGRD